MSYIFPRRVLRAQDVLDPIELTLDISPAAERLSGRLNAHNFNQNIAASVPVQANTFYALGHYQFSVPFIWTGASPNWGYPDAAFAPGFAYQVQNNFEWNTITQTAGGTPASFTISTGNSVLWINAYAQYLWYGFDRTSAFWTGFTPRNQHRHEAQYEPANMQFAIRVDGNIIPETITGIDDLTYRPSVPLKPRTQRSSASILPGPADIRGEQTAALGPPCLPVRLGALVPVQAGIHIVDIVVRRAPLINSSEIKTYKSSDKVYIFSRQLNVIDLKSFPTDSVGGSEVSAPAWDEEELITTTEIYTDRVQRIITRSNAIKEGNLSRGALMHYHLPSPLRGAYTTEIHYPTGEIFNNKMPGQNSDTVTLTHYSGSPPTGWALVTDFGAAPGGPLYLSAIPTLTAQKILVLANVQVRNIKGGALAGTGDQRAAEIAAFALFRIMWQSTTEAATTWHSGTTPGAVPSAVSDGMVNNFVWWPSDPTSGVDPTDPLQRAPLPAFGLEQVEVPLMMLIDLSTVSPSIPAVNIGMFCGTSGLALSTTACEFEIRFGSITALAFRA
jgi:hypothetical protein